MLLDAGGDSENIGVEDDVLGRKADADQKLIGTLADRNLAFLGVAWPVSSNAITTTAAP